MSQIWFWGWSNTRCVHPAQGGFSGAIKPQWTRRNPKRSWVSGKGPEESSAILPTVQEKALEPQLEVTKTPMKIEEPGAPVEEDSIRSNVAMERQVLSELDVADPEYSGGGGGGGGKKKGKK